MKFALAIARSIGTTKFHDLDVNGLAQWRSRARVRKPGRRRSAPSREIGRGYGVKKVGRDRDSETKCDT